MPLPLEAALALMLDHDRWEGPRDEPPFNWRNPDMHYVLIRRRGPVEDLTRGGDPVFPKFAHLTRHPSLFEVQMAPGVEH